MEKMPSLSQLIPNPRKDATCQLLVESGFVVKRGFLHKKQSDRRKRLFGSVLGTKWKLRYVVVSKGCIYMFKNESSAHSQRALSLFGFNEVNTYNSNKLDKFKFVIKDALEDRDWNRTLDFYTNSEADRKEWMECFRSEIFAANVHIYRSLGSLSLPRSSSSPSVSGWSTPVQLTESSVSLSTIMGSMSAIHLQRIQETLRKTETPSSDEEDDYTEIIDDDDTEEIDDSSKKHINIRGRPPLPTPQELKSANRALKKVQRTTPPPKRHSSMVLKSRTASCHSPRFPSSCEFKFPPDHCPESFQPRSPVSHSKPRLSPLPPTPSPVKPPVSPRAHKPIPPIKPQKPVPVVPLETGSPPLPKTPDPEDLAIPPKVTPRVAISTTRKKPLPPLPPTENPLTEDTSDSSPIPVISTQEDGDDDDDDDAEFHLSPMVKASYCSQDADEAQRIMLEVEEDGVFMIRKANDGQDYKTLMVRCGPKVRKYKIIREEGQLYSLHLGKSGFRNVRELLEFYFTNPIPNQSITLTKPFTEVLTLK